MNGSESGLPRARVIAAAAFKRSVSSCSRTRRSKGCDCGHLHELCALLPKSSSSTFTFFYPFSLSACLTFVCRCVASVAYLRADLRSVQKDRYDLNFSSHFITLTPLFTLLTALFACKDRNVFKGPCVALLFPPAIGLQ